MSTSDTTASTGDVRPRLRWGVPAYVLLVLAAIVVALVVPKTGYVLNISLQATTYAIAVLGLTIVLGLCGQINLAQAAFFGLGAYAVGLGQIDYGLNFWACLLIGTGIAAGFGALLGASTLRLGGHYLAMVTISFQQIVTLVLINWIPVTKGPDGVRAIPRPGFLADGSTYLAFCIAMLAGLAFLVWRLRDTRLGRAMRAVRDNELAAGVAGIDVYRTKVTAFALSAILGGIGGGLFAGGFSYVSPDQFSFAESVVFLTMVLLGGVETVSGAVVGAIVYKALSIWLVSYTELSKLVLGAIIVLIVVAFPKGIVGTFEALAAGGRLSFLRRQPPRAAQTEGAE